MADILQITEDIPVDDSIYDYEYKEYNPIAGAPLNRGSIVLTIEAQDIYTHPAESFLIVEGKLVKNADESVYNPDTLITLINNGIMYLFSDVRYHLASHEIEVLQNPGHATTILGMLKFPDDFSKSQGLNQCWIKDTGEGNTVVDGNNPNEGFKLRRNYIINMPASRGHFCFKIPLKHFLGFCEDYKKILYGMQQRLTLTRTSDDNAIFRDGGVDPGKVDIQRIRWFMPHVIPSDAYRLHLNKIIEKKEKIPVGYRMLQCDNTSITGTEFTWRLGVKSSPDIPRFIIVGFQIDRNNNQVQNPARFDNCNIGNIYVTLNAKRYPDTDYDINFNENRFCRIYGDSSTFRKKFYNMDELVSNHNINPVDYKNLYPIFVFDVTKQSEKLKTAVSDIHIKMRFNTNPALDNAGNPQNVMAYAVIISDCLFHFVSDGSKVTNIV